jgi:hypothetical protein
MYREALLDKLETEDYRGMLKQCFYLAIDGKPKFKMFDDIIDDMDDDEIVKISKLIILESRFLVSNKDSITKEIIN